MPPKSTLLFTNKEQFNKIHLFNLIWYSIKKKSVPDSKPVSTIRNLSGSSANSDLRCPFSLYSSNIDLSFLACFFVFTEILKWGNAVNKYCVVQQWKIMRLCDQKDETDVPKVLLSVDGQPGQECVHTLKCRTFDLKGWEMCQKENQLTCTL